MLILSSGTTEIFLDRLPGLPDNLSTSPDGNIFVALGIARLPGEFDPAEFMFKQPLLRKFMLRLLHLMKLPFDLASHYLDLPIARQVAYNVRFLFCSLPLCYLKNAFLFQIVNFELLLSILPKYAIILEVDWNGKIINSWHSNSPDMCFISEAKVIVSIYFLFKPGLGHARSAQSAPERNHHVRLFFKLKSALPFAIF